MPRRLISSGSTFERDIGYSRAVVDGDWIFVSGTTGFDYATMTLPEGLAAQAEQCFRNIAAALTEAGGALADVVRVHYILPDGDEFPECWPILQKYFGDVRPAATMISAGLSDPRMRIEIEVTARRSRAMHRVPATAPAGLEYVTDLVDTVRATRLKLQGITDADASRRPAPGKWSAKEIIGHLLDSAANNHGRFVRARFQDDLVFPGYDQDGWVAAQDYQAAEWLGLLQLWEGYNLHLARVMAGIPAEVRLRPHDRHNLGEIAWAPLPSGTPATLDFLLRDYVGHLRHHLKQLDALQLPGAG